MANDTSPSNTTDRKRKADDTSRTKILADCTVRDFTWYYLDVSLVAQQPTSKTDPIDALTAKKYLTIAMTQRFGVIGSAVSIDILKIENDTVWIKVPFEDRMMVTEALSGWSGNGIAWRIKQSGPWLGGLTGSSSRHLFDD